MASITISNLQLTGVDLFLDSESFFNDLTDENLNVIYGGSFSFVVTFWGTPAPHPVLA